MKMDKKQVKYIVVDAFTDTAFKGNPAAVCLLKEDTADSWLQSVAAEFKISATCYLIPGPFTSSSGVPSFRLRWFTPLSEVRLCGHGTLAAAHFCFTSDAVNGDTVEFSTLSGILMAKKVPLPETADAGEPENRRKAWQQFMIELNFPVVPLAECDSGDIPVFAEALGGVKVVDIKRTTTSDHIIIVLSSAKEVAELQPQIEEIAKCPGRGLIVTGLAPPDSEFDFFSRFFFPKVGIHEDPVCGSAHCALAPYWSKRLCKTDFLAYAASSRSGVVKVHVDEQNSRVKLQGQAVTVMQGFLSV